MTKTEALTKHWADRCSCKDYVVVHGETGCTRSGCRCRLTPQAAAVEAVAHSGGHAHAYGAARLSYSARKGLPRTSRYFALPHHNGGALPLVDDKGRLDPRHINNAAARLSMMRHEHHVSGKEYREAMKHIEAAKLRYARGG